MSDTTTIGRIVRPQGNRGEVVVVPETDRPEARFAVGEEMTLRQAGEDRPIRVRESRPQGGRWIVGFEGVASIDDAEALRGGELLIDDSRLGPLAAGEYYMHDLVGCAVETVRGDRVGTVTRVDREVGVPLLAVATRRGEALVPFVETICRTVDLERRTIVIDPPEGLLEL